MEVGVSGPPQPSPIARPSQFDLHGRRKIFRRHRVPGRSELAHPSVARVRNQYVSVLIQCDSGGSLKLGAMGCGPLIARTRNARPGDGDHVPRSGDPAHCVVAGICDQQ